MAKKDRSELHPYRLLPLGLLALVGLLLWRFCAPAPEQPPQETVELIIATDLHYLAPELTDHGSYFQGLIENADGKAVEYCEEIIDAFVSQVIAQAPDGIILSGDLTFNGAKQSHEALVQKLRQIRDAGIPVFVIPGNHDMDNSMAASFQGDGYTRVESVTPGAFSTLYQPFGYGSALSKDPHSLSYTAQLSPNLRLLMIDVNSVERPGQLAEGTLAWTEEQLAAAREAGMKVFSVSHQNLLQHNPGFAAGFVMGGNDRLLDLLEKYGVLCHFSGHMHLQHIAQSANGLHEVATSSLLVSPLQYGVLRLEGTTGQYRTAQVEVSADIGAYAKAFFWDTAYRQARRALGDLPGADSMAAYFADINAAYFSGRMDTAEYDTEPLKKWEEQDAFLSLYLQSIAGDAGKDHTTLTFDLSGGPHGPF